MERKAVYNDFSAKGLERNYCGFVLHLHNSGEILNMKSPPPIMKDCIRVFRALSHETRLKILFYLLDGERCVCDIVEHVGKSQPTISNHLSRLQKDAILTSKREGQWVYYDIADERARGIIKTCRSISIIRQE